MAESLEERAVKLALASESLVVPGTWGTLSFVVPDKLEKVRGDINDFFELLLLQLEVVNQALEFAKAFLTAYVDPIDAILQALLAEIRALADDIRQLGIYITSDAALFGNWPPDDLLGGYGAYERRMVARLTDKADPTRPDVSSKTTVFSLFVYLSADATEVQKLIKTVKALVSMFTGGVGGTGSTALPTPIIREVFYGNDAIDIFTPRSISDALLDFDGNPPTRFKITWQVNPGSFNQLNPFSQVVPAGFIVTVSTLPEGLHVKYARPKLVDTKRLDKSGNRTQPREYGPVVHMGGGPVVLHGGAAMLQFDEKLDFNQAVSDEGWKDGCAAIYGLPDPASPEVIPLALLSEDGPDGDHELGTAFDGKGSKYYLQRAFLVTQVGVAFEYATGTFSLVLDKDDLPNKARIVKQPDGTMLLLNDGPADNYYIRVAALKSGVVDSGTYKWDLRDPPEDDNAHKSDLPWAVPHSDVGAFSDPVLVSVPGSDSAAYVKTLEMAIKLLLLTRPDLPHIDTIKDSDPKAWADAKENKVMKEGFVLKYCGLEPSVGLLERMFPEGYAKWISSVDSSPSEFVSALDKVAKEWASKLYAATGTNHGLENRIVEATVDLRTTTLADIFDKVTLVESPLSQHVLQKTSGLEVLPDQIVVLEEEQSLTVLDEKGQHDLRMGSVVIRDILVKTDKGKLPADLTFMDFLNGKGPDFLGFARNPWSLGFESISNFFHIATMIRGRKPHFIEIHKESSQEFFEKNAFYGTASPEETQRRLAGVTVPGLAEYYRHYIQEDGTIKIPGEHGAYLHLLVSSDLVQGSADKSPVLWGVVNGLQDFDAAFGNIDAFFMTDASMVFMRTLLAEYKDGLLLRQANLILTTASAAKTRLQADGEWIAIRAFDMLPGLGVVFDTLADWLDAIGKSVKSAVDAILEYIEFLQAQIIRLQQLLRMINAFIQSLLNFRIVLPRLSALSLISQGTDGVTSGLITASEKPQDSPLAYGAGLALVIPAAPTFLVDLFLLQDDEETSVIGVPDTIGLEGLPPPGTETPTEEPDVL